MLGGTMADYTGSRYNHVVMNFNRGHAAPSTRNEVPFFIPVVLRPNNGKPDIKVAFLESRGEDYKIKAETIEYFPKLKNEILPFHLPSLYDGLNLAEGSSYSNIFINVLRSDNSSPSNLTLTSSLIIILHFFI
jgi:hypothetical protein